MNTPYEITGTYGSYQNTTTIYVYGDWYVCDDSVNVNACDSELLIDGVNIETLPDYDKLSSLDPIISADQLENFIDNQ